MLASRCGKYGAASMSVFRPRHMSAINRAVPSEVVMPRPSWPVANHSRLFAALGPISGNLSGVAARCPAHMRMATSSITPGRNARCATHHVLHQPHLHVRVLDIELTRGTDQHLPGLPRLDIEGDRLAVGSVCAFQVAQFDQLVVHEIRDTGR